MICSHSVWKNPSSLWWLSCSFLLSVIRSLPAKMHEGVGTVFTDMWLSSCMLVHVVLKWNFTFFFKNKTLYFNATQNRLFVMCWRGGITTQQLFWKITFLTLRLWRNLYLFVQNGHLNFPSGFPLFCPPGGECFNCFDGGDISREYSTASIPRFKSAPDSSRCLCLMSRFSSAYWTNDTGSKSSLVIGSV